MKDNMNCDHNLGKIDERHEPNRIIIVNKCSKCGQIEEDIYIYSDTIFIN